MGELLALWEEDRGRRVEDGVQAGKRRSRRTPGAVRDHAGGGGGSGRGGLRSGATPAAVWVERVHLLRVRRGLEARRGSGGRRGRPAWSFLCFFSLWTAEPFFSPEPSHSDKGVSGPPWPALVCCACQTLSVQVFPVSPGFSQAVPSLPCVCN